MKRGIVIAFVAACSAPGPHTPGEIEVDVQYACVEDCVADQDNQANVTVQHDVGAAYSCTVAPNGEIAVGPRQGDVFDGTLALDTTGDANSESSTHPFFYRCRGDGGSIVVTCRTNPDAEPRMVSEVIECPDVPAGPPAALLDVTGTTDAYSIFIYSSAPAFGQSLARESEQITNLAIGSCVSFVRESSNVTLESAGTVEIKNDSALVATLVKSPSSERRDFGPFTVTPGTAYDIVLGGAGAVAASIGNNVLRPAPIATFTNLGFVDDTLTDRTFTYQPVDADFLFMIFSYLAGSTPVQLWCRLDPAGTSYTMAQADFDGLSFSGTVRGETQNRGTFPLGGTNTSVMVNAHSSTMNGQFTKPAP